jgi:hypothetical protein
MRSQYAMYCAMALACGAATVPRQPLPTPEPAKPTSVLPALRCGVPFDAVGNAWLERVEWTVSPVDAPRGAAVETNTCARIVRVAREGDGGSQTFDVFDLTNLCKDDDWPRALPTACDGGTLECKTTFGARSSSSFVPQARSFSEKRGGGDDEFGGIASVVAGPLSSISDFDWGMLSHGEATIIGRYVGERPVGAIAFRHYDLSVKVEGADQVGGMGAMQQGRSIFQPASIALTGAMTLRSADGALLDLRLKGRTVNYLGAFDIMLHTWSPCFR